MEPSWPPKTEPKHSKIGVEKALEFDQNFKAFWNAIFSVKKRQRGPMKQILAGVGGMGGPPGEDLRRGSRICKVIGGESSTPTTKGGGKASPIPPTP